MTASAEARFKEPPVYEAIVEAIFPEDIGVPRLLEVFRDRYPIEVPLQTVTVHLGPGAADTNLPPGTVTHRLFTADGKALVNFGPRIFSFNVLDYQGFGAFRDAVRREFAIIGTRLTIQAEQVGLKYLNRLKVPSGITDTSNLVNIRIEVPEPIGRVQQLNLNAVYESSDEIVVFLNFHTPPLSLATKFVFFHLAAISKAPFSAEWLETAHDKLRAIFDSALPDAVAREHGALFL